MRPVAGGDGNVPREIPGTPWIGSVVNFTEIIARKRDAHALTPEEISSFIRGVTDGTVGHEQAAALLMAYCIRGAEARETQALVENMRDSGEVWGLGAVVPEAVDKHSTGGIGDTVSLILAPLLAACGVPVAMMAGAGLGHSQGTLDKLASIPGFRTAGNREEALALLGACGCCFAAQTERIAPADRILYALRDVTATVPSLPLIVASIMSKKLAVGARNLVLDVKWGSGAFRKTLPEAEELAEVLTDVGRRAGVRVSTLVTDMNQPLGAHLGCASEVRAALAVLGGAGDARLRELTVELAEECLVLGGRERGVARDLVSEALERGAAREAWTCIVEAHGGDPDPRRLPEPERRLVVPADDAGFITSVDGETLGWIAVVLGAGRRRRDDVVDHAAGLLLHRRPGERVNAGEPLVTLELGRRPVEAEVLAERVRSAFTIGDDPPAPLPLVAARIGGGV